jgi:aryl-alcohol dehydrogenase-like predicted oxidoreductase
MTELPTTVFGPDAVKVTRIGLGGEGVLRTRNRKAEAREVIHEAIQQKITYFDTAPAYQDSQSYLGSVWAEQPEARDAVFQTSKSPGRRYDQAMVDLNNSLKLLNSNHLDLWQIHDLRTWEEVRQIEGAQGALKAFTTAREQGLVRHIGVTGHHDPEVLGHAVANWPLDSVLLPANPAEAILGGFLDGVVSKARERKLTVIGMKCLGGGQYVQPDRGISAEMLIQYALNCPVDLIIIGCSSPEQVKAMVSTASKWEAGGLEPQQIEEAFRPYAAKLAFYRGTLRT